ncbi:hypothetical protein [Elizabethkingia anophelis]|uniref:hypothetical protein n=1 Tax=Elizabethkingia anophelis TaxID=1117645 RepID=UPI00136F3CE3|nr:hypothetical protein [Elizabethkingia anophelis]MCT4142358.1 hypothetical protein [Elizabethkingia anophelis]MCT4277964.1 hypothetical protein [Elizabethkingia anophelis]MCT4281378.1 hypothetical protein [Elizabethkingia anophelis]MYY44170.1 hypothetical protein [Elizabethkingia anophelis]
MSNRQLEEKQQEEANKAFAAMLGITYEEFLELEYEPGEVTSEEGLVYRRYLKFNPDYGKAILEKIKGLDGNLFYFQ